MAKGGLTEEQVLVLLMGQRGTEKARGGYCKVRIHKI
jgi:hypothetical protein